MQVLLVTQRFNCSCPVVISSMLPAHLDHIGVLPERVTLLFAILKFASFFSLCVCGYVHVETHFL